LAGTGFAQGRSNAVDERLARKQFEEDRRLDEFANSMRRRDWLKDRLILQVGMGSRFPMMGEDGLGFGAGVEYITRWHVSAWGSLGYVPSFDDPQFPQYTLDPGMGWRFGFGYHFFPKNALHMSILASYGTVWYDHNQQPPDSSSNNRPIIMNRGWELDLALTYLTDQWYYLQILVGFYYTGDNLPGTSNDTWMFDVGKDKNVSKVINKDGIPNVGVVFGINIGFSFPEFFPDDTEIRRREREQKYERSSERPADRKTNTPTATDFPW
jgi:hypothetical protein